MTEVISLTELETSDKLYDLTKEDREFIINDKRLGLEIDGKISAKEYVGSMTLPSQQYVVNIKPKISHTNFLKLLSYAYLDRLDVNFDGLSKANEEKSLFELLAQLFTKEAMRLVKSGLYRNYITETQEISSIRGRLLVAPNIRNPQRSLTKQWCEYDEISYDVLVNQCILFCTTKLIRLSTNLETKRELIRIKNIFLSQDISLKKISYNDANSIFLQRLNKKYENIIKFCKLILRQLAYGEFVEKGIAIPDITFSMWYLFEKFVHKCLKESFSSYTVTKPNVEHIIQRIQGYSSEDEYFRNTDSIPRLEPDNFIRRGDKKLILDTKYKHEIGNEDFYQAISYSLKKKCDTILLQPKSEKKISDGFTIDRELTGLDLKIHIKTIDFEEAERDEGNFVENLQKQIVDVVKSVNF